jgi:hypothetical protein
VQKQKVAVASELKSVLDSWVRYEQQMKESEQAELSKAVINKVLATINEPRTQQDILASAVAEVEREFGMQFAHLPVTDALKRTRQEQGYLTVESRPVFAYHSIDYIQYSRLSSNTSILRRTSQ